MQIEIEKNQIFKQIQNFYPLEIAQQRLLESFVLSILQENQKFNFIGKSTVDEIWHRHILDCAQLIQYVKEPRAKFADLGSGAGLPGVVMSILGLKEIHLIEKSFRKADFLRRIKNISKNRIFVHQAKLEELDNMIFDCIMSRALASLDKLLEYCQKFLKKDGYCLFLKGKNLSVEIAEAKNKFNFEYELFPSLTSVESNIIRITNISTK
ncbi:MAG: 16S rRNA (guanine(527)-N(7))-methyltransferase RsmG [Alphaproteobacteria bacterium]|nr:16S rRNA (guanine(527)-N(7))-methyltransferase RsmG [Alphaproteobacteria bacterium]